ncbi:hypothetical protein EU803_05585 [Loktanella sp. IMCC34160]|uniref:head-tail connector protein n=1 Tax=Loktanella sp. IMCC34160 TaxID=2510646 RepID=UPI00101C5364|nr:phage head-tail connector protein [Loktanella sp. IMCC34160]RYG91923.1 hypothetical protein EU803_05585 [Loktanella sp. IMCC34160]
MMLVEETTVPQAALPVAVFKEHLHLGSGFADDGLQDAVLETYLRAALAAVEARTGKILIERDFSWTLSAWRDHAEQALQVAPVSAIADLRIAGRDGIETSVSVQAYQLIPDSQRPRLAATGGALPTIPPGGSARVVFMAGYGPDWADLPADLAQAVLMLAAHYYEFRHDMRGTGGAMPQGVAALIDRYRTVRLFAGGRG